ncbi:MAG TPA: tRNA (adenosine(37)-N6)-dimethylallyltransferase MiaA [Rudaea sp.]|jgi:tRNA dimethylallyltransferase|nr:tRNA (adenosine(37)-N6)-dimethylallyltransferase MiaA [Rudaea sp.]
MTIDTRPLAIFLMGPTASGKTALACELARRFPLDLISVDSALVYRGLNIGAAKPDAATLEEFPHRLIDIRDPAQAYSAAEFRADALREMKAITATGKIPLLVGGTGLYFRALQSGLSNLPEADAELRARLADEAAQLGWPALHARLRGFDAQAAERIGPDDAQRIQRALEVIEITGMPLSAQQGGLPAPFGYRVLKLALIPHDRAVLHERIAQRMDAMLVQGFLAEVRALRARGDLHADLPAVRAVGYRQAWQHLDGEFDAGEFRDRAVFATRQLAKRQLTWLRGELDGRVLDPLASSDCALACGAVADFLGVAPA